jgi:hypothetical protein
MKSASQPESPKPQQFPMLFNWYKRLSGQGIPFLERKSLHLVESMDVCASRAGPQTDRFRLSPNRRETLLSFRFPSQALQPIGLISPGLQEKESRIG